MASALCQRSISSRAVRAQTPRRSVAVKAASRPVWLPGGEIPAHLDGTLAGDFGFDPLGLGKDKEALRWYTQAELIHGRTAMTAVAGILIPSILTKAGALNVPEWYDAGKVYIESENAIPFGPLLAVQFYLYGWAESKRWMDFKKPGSQAEKGSFVGLEGAFKGVANGYPGGFFDPLGLSKGPSFEQFKLREVKNGRLAMLAFIGFVAQHAATGKGPVDNLLEHVADPWHKTFAENGVSVPFL